MFTLFGNKNEEVIVSESRISDLKFFELEIQRFKVSRRRKDMLDGERYHEGKHDILSKKRTIIGENGEVEVVENLPNNRIVDNQYGKMVDQKKNYLLGQPIVFKATNKLYGKHLKQIFNKRFQRLIKNVGEDSLNTGIGWLFIYYDENGKFNFKRFKSYEIIPGWKDAEHSELEYAIRLYEVVVYEGAKETCVEKVEIYDVNGIYRFVLENGRLVPDQIPFSNYFTTIDEHEGEIIEQGWNWDKIPLIPFKCNGKEIPLIKRVKSLQDGLNTILSNFQNNMEEDARNTILILVNYDGQNLGEFRKNLATYGAVKVKTVDGAAGDLKTLQVEVNAENYKSIIDIFKKAIIENAKGYDAKDDRLSSNPNQMNIQSMYSDIDLDANEMETEYQASFEDLLWFINVHLFNVGAGDFEGEEVEIIFNRDIMISESEAIGNIKDSVGIISDETLIAQHPWVDDPEAELNRIEAQKQKELDSYANAFDPALDKQERGKINEEA
ncbi:SPP1 family phage portal protein [Fontibacillus solani]|uniref:SPP1 family phage portal protein n=1 Tax=Fontibacillus solani TaxID=1572857 RepID=A0A7W3XT80_9BACL|nr:phage portal protein [Fontibacillus solani]MBA9087482.1 SPP1 family phage portal protein [Fontibacillus solani]